MTTLTLDGIDKFYGDLHILKDINLEVGQGEFISLLGPSGCGKTTTLRCIAGFEPIDRGRLLFGTREMTNVAPEHRDLGMVFQSYALFPHMTVAENLAFGLEVRKVAPAERAARIAKVLEMVRLAGYEGRFPRELSGGQQQRVALARALVIEPAVLLLDEPLANLDAALRDDMRFFIRDLQQRVGITTIYVTHDQSEALVMSDRIVVMEKGVVAQCGAPKEIYERPASRMVAGFIGHSDVIEGTVLGREGEAIVIETAAGRLRAHGPKGVSGQVQLMIRPEKLRPDLAENAMTGRVTKAIYQGSALLVVVALPSGQEISALLDADAAVAVGAELTLGFAARHGWVIAP